MYVLMCAWLYEAWNGAGLLLSYLLVLPEVSLDGDGDSVVLQLAGRITGKPFKHMILHLHAKRPLQDKVRVYGVSEAATGKDRGIHKNYRQLWSKID